MKHKLFISVLSCLLLNSISCSSDDETVDNFEEVDSIEVANPGFINITFKIEFWRDYLSQILKLKNSYGINKNIKK